MIRLLTFTTLYPNAKSPSHGVFVENRLRQLVAGGAVSATVVAPVPYVPALRALPRRYDVWRGVPAHEERNGISVHHPRYFLLPKVSTWAAPLALYFAAKRCIGQLMARGLTFDLIDAHYFYPDGVAAILLARDLGKPVTVTARGSDINIIPQYRVPRTMIRWAARQADGIIAVCEALKTSLVELGASPTNVRVLRNGVDLVRFHPHARASARRRVGFTGTTLLSVGKLVPLKGHDLAISALPLQRDVCLAIVGEGPERGNLEALARRLGVADRVRFLGQVAHDRLPEIYSAADAVLLLSSHEGMANVLLEAMACGAPIVATAVGGTPEIVPTPLAGELVPHRDPISIARSVGELLARAPDRQAIRAYAEGLGWDSTTKGQLDLFSAILRARGGSALGMAADSAAAPPALT